MRGGETIAEALARAAEALATVFEALMKDRRDIPVGGEGCWRRQYSSDPPAY